MTIRVRPADRGRTTRDPNRRTLYTNIAFALTIVIAVVILVVVGVATWYNGHLAAAASVDGQTITKDQFFDRYRVEAFRAHQLEQQVKDDLAAGRLTGSQADARIQSIQQELDDTQGQFSATILEKLIDTRIQAKLATDLGVTISAQRVDERITEEKTRKEQRHAWLIAVKPEVNSGATEPSILQKAVAKKKADDALASIKGGKSFEDVAKAISTDSSKTSGGDLGWIDTDSGEDAAWEAAVFKLDQNGVTDVILGADGTYRIGRVTDIVPAHVDDTFDQKLAAANVSQDSYRAAITSEVTRTALGDKIVADASASGPEREVQELYIKAPSTAPATGAIKVRHILYSPNNKPDAASAVPTSDPAWTVARLAAQKAYDKIKADPKQFDTIARAESDEASAQGVDGTGGKLPYFDPTSSIDASFAAAIFKPGLKPGDLLAPFQSAFGWHVVQIMYGPPDSDEMNKLKTQAAAPGADFAQIVRDFSDGPKAGSGGNIGWVHQGQLDDRLTAKILATPAGSFTDIVDIPDDGLYLFKVLTEKTAAPDAAQLSTIKANAFGNWYKGKKAAVKITRDLLGS